MKLEVTEKIAIPDGLHRGAITGVDYRKEPFEYTDIVIAFIVGKKEIKLKAGYPTIVSDSSKLGKLLTRFGVLLNVGSQVDPDVLIGKRCQFQTITENTKNGEFAKVLPDSVKP